MRTQNTTITRVPGFSYNVIKRQEINRYLLIQSQKAQEETHGYKEEGSAEEEESGGKEEGDAEEKKDGSKEKGSTEEKGGNDEEKVGAKE